MLNNTKIATNEGKKKIKETRWHGKPIAGIALSMADI
jgi:hypothetical protein